MQPAVSVLPLFVLCYSTGVSSQLMVTQSRDVSLEEGQTAQISCCWSGEHERTAVIWMKMQKEVKREVLSKDACSQLKMSSIRKEHSGTYICKVNVEIPYLIRGSGKGTAITVRSKAKKTEETKDGGSLSLDVLGQGLRCLPLVTLLLVSVYLYKTLVKKRRQEPSPQRGHEDIELQSLQ